LGAAKAYGTRATSRRRPSSVISRTFSFGGAGGEEHPIPASTALASAKRNGPIRRYVGRPIDESCVVDQIR